MVAGLELRDLGTDRLRHPGAIRYGDKSIGARQPPRHHTQIVKVQGGGVHAHADGVRSGFTGVGEVHERQAVEPLVWMSLDGFHRRTCIRAVD